MQHFLKISKYLGGFSYLTQGAGGNSSVKMGNNLIIKSSGVFLKDIKADYGYVTCSLGPIVQKLNSIKSFKPKHENQFDLFVQEMVDLERSYGKPSMETAFHVAIDSKYIFHTHSVFVNIFSCMNNGQAELKKIIKDIPFLFLQYYNPGLELGYALAKFNKTKELLSSVIILQNHGLITHHQNPQTALKLTKSINDAIVKYLKSKKVYKPFKVLSESADLSRHLFPDSAVYSQVDFTDLSSTKKQVYYEICSAHNYILNTIKALGKKPRFISSPNVRYIQNMQKELYRIKMLQTT